MAPRHKYACGCGSWLLALEALGTRPAQVCHLLPGAQPPPPPPSPTCLLLAGRAGKGAHLSGLLQRQVEALHPGEGAGGQ